MDFCLTVCLVCMLFAQYILLPCRHNILIFLWGATYPHFPSSGSSGVFPSPPSSNSRQATQASQWEDTSSVTGSGWPIESQPRNFCWNYWEQNSFLPTGVAQRVECKAGANHREGGACLRRKVTKRRAQEGSPGAIPNSIIRVPESSYVWEWTGLFNCISQKPPFLPSVCATSVSDNCN